MSFHNLTILFLISSLIKITKFNREHIWISFGHGHVHILISPNEGPNGIILQSKLKEQILY